MTLPDDVKQSFAAATEVTKQLMTLGTGSVALTVTFVKDLSENLTDTGVCAIRVAWVAMIVSLVLGLISLMALAGQLSSKKANADIFDTGPAIFAGAQMLTFVVGIVAYTVAGWDALS